MKSPILFYDGYCALCNFFVRFLLKFDSKQLFFYAALDSEIAQNTLQTFHIDPSIDSIIFYDGTKIYTHHEAVFKILRLLPYPIKTLLIFNLLPNILNKKLYQFIAKKRYSVFGKYESCPLPPIKNRKQFLH
ncbi:MAG: hypothetical protein CFE21_12320 [Bacteroidetes bacterium B1(2017)]|nr:MAG: hypothetical protein CFE21_12320 [Bacteroidetes bacterium B1(2017)]